MAIRDDAVGRLLEWESYAGAPVEAIGRVLAHEQFPRAARLLAANMLAMVEHDEVMADICKDAGRYVAVMCALHLHITDRLTLPRLKQLGTTTGYFSPGRARVVLRMLEHIGYVIPDDTVERRRATQYVPTDRFTTAWRNHLHLALEAAAVIEPSAALASSALYDPEITATFVRLQSDGLIRTASQPAPKAMPFMQVVLHRHAGSQFAWMLLAADDDDGIFPTRRTAPMAIAAVARRFGVSRVHIRRLLRDATAEGLIDDSLPGTVRFAESAHEEIRFLYAAQLAQLLTSAAGMMRTVRARSTDVKPS